MIKYNRLTYIIFVEHFTGELTILYTLREIPSYHPRTHRTIILHTRCEFGNTKYEFNLPNLANKKTKSKINKHVHSVQFIKTHKVVIVNFT